MAAAKGPKAMAVHHRDLHEQQEERETLLQPTAPSSSNEATQSKRNTTASMDKLVGKSPSSRLVNGAKAVVICLLYMWIGPTLIILNKHILKDIGFNHPMFLSGLGLAASSLVSHLLVRVFKVVELQHSSKITTGFYLKNMLPVGASHALTLAFGNAVYLYLTVSFIQMLKAFTPVMVLIVVSAFGIEKPSYKVIFSVLGICAGTAIASVGEMNFSPIGIGIMFMAELTEATRLVLTQYLLNNLKFGIIEGQYYLAPAGALCLFAASALMESTAIMEKGSMALIVQHPWMFLGAAFLGLGVQFLTFLVIQATGSVTLKVLGTARNAFLVVVSVYFMDELVMPLQFFGYFVSLSFFALYNYFKMNGQ